MVKKLHAVFDGRVLQPEEPVGLAPNTRVCIIIEIPPKGEKKPASFLEAASSLKLDGPPDWSERLEEYLYGEKINADK